MKIEPIIAKIAHSPIIIKTEKDCVSVAEERATINFVIMKRRYNKNKVYFIDLNIYMPYSFDDIDNFFINRFCPRNFLEYFSSIF